MRLERRRNEVYTCLIILKWKNDGNKLCRNISSELCEADLQFLPHVSAEDPWVLSTWIFWSTEYRVPGLGGTPRMLGEIVGGMLEGMVLDTYIYS